MSKLINDKVSLTIVKMAIPMLAGTFAMNMYNLTNAWFVSKLGTDELAAISFAFPVIMFLMCLTRGLGSGAMTLVAHAIGGKDGKKAAEITTHALVLTVVFGLLMTVTGILTIRPLFMQLGATGNVLDLTEEYMKIWYMGAVVMVLQMVASDIIIGTGNTKAISTLMVGSTAFNIFFDIGFIFGKFGMPKMGIAGAAVATILAEGLALICAVAMLNHKMKMIRFSESGIHQMLRSWGKILKFGIPGALGMVLSPISAAVVVNMVAKYGDAAVAATGVAARIELFAFMIPMTVGMSLIPFIAQNYGAGRVDRIRSARKGTMTFAVIYGVFIAVIFFVMIDPFARLFSNDRTVIEVLKNYIFITCFGYGLLEVHRYAGFCMTGVHEPLKASILNIIRILVLLIPLSLAGDYFFKLNGIFWGRLATDILAGVIGIIWSGKVLSDKLQKIAH